jgi:uncharacterized circularly permuted ATP-grasp superfamily protein/uncharacterized alpha-E superfamily protein
MVKIGIPFTSSDDAFLHGYTSLPGHFDEVLAGDGTITPHWQSLFQGINALGKSGFAQRRRQVARLAENQGAGFAAFEGVPTFPVRSWQLDPLPFILSAADWKTLEAGLSQRLRLLNAVLQDVYGEQRAIHQGILPPAVILGNPNFLRACHGFCPPRDWFIHLLGVDVFRSPDGSWRVLADRVQKPAGIGEAVENRLTLSQMFLDLFHDHRVLQLGRFCSSLQKTLASIAPRNSANPYIVLLTSGPHGKTYLEDAFLARFMGYPLVEGGDLTVRDNRVFFKTLTGLHAVDVIFRRMNDEGCDPLALPSVAVSGVPGLLESMRAGQVSVAGALGAGLVETPVLSQFMGDLCRFFLGEDLLLRDAETLWLGAEAHLNRVTGNLPEFLIQPSFSKSSKQVLLGKDLDPQQQMKLVDRMKARPYEFTARPLPALSTVPVWSGGKAGRGFLLLRLFAVPTEGGAAVMPGGFARLARHPETLPSGRKNGLMTKDTWVGALDAPSVAPAEAFAEPFAEPPVEITREGRDLQSRLADHFFWLGRYLERVENTVRLSRSVLRRLTEENEFVSEIELSTLLSVLSNRGVYPAPQEDPAKAITSIDLSVVMGEFVRILFEEKPGSIKSLFSEVRRVALLVKDRLASDTWRVLRRLEKQLVLSPASKKPNLSELLETVNEVILILSAFSGLSMEDITRSHDWRFLDMGRRIERGVHTVDLVHSALVEKSSDERPVLEAVLEAADSSMTYRARYRSSLQAAPVIDLLFLDEINPRSAAFQAAEIDRHLSALPWDAGNGGDGMPSPSHSTISSILQSLRSVDVGGLARCGESARRDELDRFSASLNAQFQALSDHIFREYFIHVRPSERLVALNP